MVLGCFTGNGFGGYNMFFIGIFWIVIVALIIWAIMKFVSKEGLGNFGTKSPLEIAKERYAKGEINKKTFEEMRKELR